jgi:phage terminase Nu1 subunit (DNA packaging protein)
MPKKADRRVPLPAGLLPLLSQKELETYYGVSDWTVLQWIEQGMPVERLKSTSEAQKKEIRRFDLTEVKAWMAEQDQLAAAS